MAKSAPPPGTGDIFPDEIMSWLHLEQTARNVFSLYGFGEIRTPIFEFTEVFQRGLGNETEVVQKEMYTFEDRGGRSLTLRPEGTAGVMRALAGTEAMNGVETRVFYLGPMFRGERPAAKHGSSIWAPCSVVNGPPPDGAASSTRSGWKTREKFLRNWMQNPLPCLPTI